MPKDLHHALIDLRNIFISNDQLVEYHLEAAEIESNNIDRVVFIESAELLYRVNTVISEVIERYSV